MSVSNLIVNNFSLTTQGQTITGNQGLSANAFGAALTQTVAGTVKHFTGTLATATIATLYNTTNDLPATFLYFWLCVDQGASDNVQVQVIDSATNVIHALLANVPFVLHNSHMLAAASTTAITGASQTSLNTIAKIVLGNYSGVTLNYEYAVIL